MINADKYADFMLTPKTSNIVQVNLNISFIIFLIITKNKFYIVIIDIVIIFKKHLEHVLFT